MTYRRRYRPRAEPGAVLDLLLDDETNPRSVRYQLLQLDALLDGLRRRRRRRRAAAASSRWCAGALDDAAPRRRRPPAPRRAGSTARSTSCWRALPELLGALSDELGAALLPPRRAAAAAGAAGMKFHVTHTHPLRRTASRSRSATTRRTCSRARPRAQRCRASELTIAPAAGRARRARRLLRQPRRSTSPCRSRTSELVGDGDAARSRWRPRRAAGVRRERRRPWDAARAAAAPTTPTPSGARGAPVRARLAVRRRDARGRRLCRAVLPPGRPLLDAVHDLNRRIHREFTYDPRAPPSRRRSPRCWRSATASARTSPTWRSPACARSACRRATSAATSRPCRRPAAQRLRGADASHAWFARLRARPRLGRLRPDQRPDRRPTATSPPPGAATTPTSRRSRASSSAAARTRSRWRWTWSGSRSRARGTRHEPRAAPAPSYPALMPSCLAPRAAQGKPPIEFRPEVLLIAARGRIAPIPLRTRSGSANPGSVPPHSKARPSGGSA